MHFCPHDVCGYRGWLGLNNLRANGHPNGGPWRQFHCTACEEYFSEHHGTIFYGKQAEGELIVRILTGLAEGLGIRATARVFEVEANTVLHWLVEAAEQLRAFCAYFLCDLHLKQLQLDELYAVLSAVKDGEITAAEVTKRLSFCALGLGGDRSREHTTGGHRRRRAHPGDGASLRPPRRSGVGTRWCAALFDRWIARVRDGLRPATERCGRGNLRPAAG